MPRTKVTAEAADKAQKTTKRRASGTSTAKKSVVKKAAPKKVASSKEHIFALDIGTRSVIGIVADKTDDGLSIIATDRREHKTRAMLDGQIHDVPQVAAVINDVKTALEEKTGPIKHAAVAAAGRALYTMTAEAEMEVSGVITPDVQRSLDFAGVQAAQAKLGSTKAVEDLSLYYCVGYSTVKYSLDGSDLKLLIGQRGRVAKATVIATFLPRQVIDSMQSALATCDLDMSALTLEPIAAINVLIPPTMRHLNLVLVDIGAGTSDVAITKNGSVIAYGMVPLAGDEITEAISQKFLLDFNVAEKAKRDAANGDEIHFTDILGAEYSMSADELLEPVVPSIKKLAAAIADQIIELNTEAPQAVMLVGGGSLTPRLAKYVSEALKLPENRVAVRKPSDVNGIENIPDVLHSPDAVTPLGILKIAALNTLHFFSVYVNGEEYRMFNFRQLTVSDALLNAGVNLKKYNGRPGLGLMVTVNGKKKFFPGTLGTLARLALDGVPASLDTPIKNGSHIDITPGENGESSTVTLADVTDEVPESIIYVNGMEKHIRCAITVNGEKADATRVLKDNDVIEAREPQSVGEALLAAGYSPTGSKLRYRLNGSSAHYILSPEILLNDEPAPLGTAFHEGDNIEYVAPDPPKLGDVLHITDSDMSIGVFYNGKEYRIPVPSITLKVNGRPASPGTIVEEGADVSYQRMENRTATVSEALVAVNFQPPAASTHAKVSIFINKKQVEFTDPVRNNDTLDILIETPQPEGAQAPTAATSPAITPSAAGTTLQNGQSAVKPKLTIQDFIHNS